MLPAPPFRISVHGNASGKCTIFDREELVEHTIRKGENDFFVFTVKETAWTVSECIVNILL